MEGKPLALACLGAAAVVIFGGVLLLYGASPPPAPPVPKSPPPVNQMMPELKYSQPIYQALIEQDAKKYAVSAPALAELAQPIPYYDEIRGRRALKPGKPLETRHLTLTLKVEKRQAIVDGQTFRADHLVLDIENRTDNYLAYRVVTQVPRNQRCQNKGDIPHNAIILAPHTNVQRTECLFRDASTLDLLSVEVMEVAPLAAHYLSRLPPALVLYDARTASGHVPLAGELCPQTFSWSEIRDGVERNEFDWKDIMDFYARHNCDEYAFFRAYRYRSDASAPLPARPST
ncbi:MAG: hypothetical protein KA712_13285 [Myxococcales bacterium]|nr:hypothetical protein [Myxococcales bacterium]